MRRVEHVSQSSEMTNSYRVLVGNLRQRPFGISIHKWENRVMKFQILCFVDHASLYNLVTKTNLVHNLFLVYLSISGETTFMRHLVLLFCMVDRMQRGIHPAYGQPYRITSTKCHVNTVVSPDDGQSPETCTD